MAGPDVFDQLLSVKWRDVEFPITRHRMSVAHDLVPHTYWGVDGARVESTGLAPNRFTFSAPLINGISPGKNETWAALYPNQFRKLLAAFQLKAKGVLQHPEFGEIVCKAEKFDADWEATRRGGVDAELSFVETKVDGDTDFLAFPGSNAQPEIGSLDSVTVKRDLKALLEAAGLPLPAYLVDNKISLTDFLRQVKAVADYPALLEYRGAGRINSLFYHAGNIQKSVDKLRSPKTWSVTRDIERLKAGAFEAGQKLLEGSKDIGFYKVPAPTTLAGITRQIPGAKIADIIKLNPGIMRSPAIDKDKVVRYFINRAA